MESHKSIPNDGTGDTMSVKGKIVKLSEIMKDPYIGTGITMPRIGFS